MKAVHQLENYLSLHENWAKNRAKHLFDNQHFDAKSTTGLHSPKFNFGNNLLEWIQVADSGIVFFFYRTTYGFREDYKFVNHFQGARTAGLVTGAYHFLRLNNRVSAEAQAQTFIEASSDTGGLTDPMLPHCSRSGRQSTVR